MSIVFELKGENSQLAKIRQQIRRPRLIQLCRERNQRQSQVQHSYCFYSLSKTEQKHEQKKKRVRQLVHQFCSLVFWISSHNTANRTMIPKVFESVLHQDVSWSRNWWQQSRYGSLNTSSERSVRAGKHDAVPSPLRITTTLLPFPKTASTLLC